VVARPVAQNLRAVGRGRPQGPPLQRDSFTALRIRPKIPQPFAPSRFPSPQGLVVTHIFCWTPGVDGIGTFSPKGAT
jgi:hypothetical protein